MLSSRCVMFGNPCRESITPDRAGDEPKGVHAITMPSADESTECRTFTLRPQRRNVPQEEWSDR